MTRRGLFLSLFCGLAAAPFGGAWAAGDRLRYGPDPRQTVEMLAPRGAAGRPVLVLFADERGEGRKLARRLARRGFVVALAGLRTVGGSETVMIAEAAVATVWVADRAAGFGGDPARLGVLGLGRRADAALMIALDRRYMAGRGRSDLIRVAASWRRSSPDPQPDPTLTRPEAYIRVDAPPIGLAGGGDADLALAARIRALGGRVQVDAGRIAARAAPRDDAIEGLYRALAPLQGCAVSRPCRP